jgi:hypothetical protein
VTKGSRRDSAILEAVNTCKVMNTEQLTELFFKFPSGKRRCQARMKVLSDKKLVKKFRLSLDSSTIYYTGSFPGQPKHSLALSWVYAWMMNRPGEKLLTWDLEELSEFNLRVDILCSTKILITNEIRYYCIEFCRGSVSLNKYKKIDLYDDLYKREGISGSKLMQKLVGAERFPKVILVTDDAKHGAKIRELVTKATSPVRYEVVLLSSLTPPSYSFII